MKFQNPISYPEAGMKKAGLSIAEIAHITGLPEDEIRHYI